MKRSRRADPYRDTHVIDERAPRVNQAVVGVVALAAVLTGWWWLLALLALQLALGLTLGRRWCLACVLYFEVLQPRLGEGRLEDARPPRFANLVGLVVLTSASVAYAARVRDGRRRARAPRRRTGAAGGCHRLLRRLQRLQDRVPPHGTPDSSPARCRRSSGPDPRPAARQGRRCVPRASGRRRRAPRSRPQPRPRARSRPRRAGRRA